MSDNSQPQKPSRFNLFKRFFKIGINPDKTQPSDQIFPIKPTYDDNGDVNFNPEIFPPEVQRFYNYFLTQRNNRERIKDRDKLWEDLTSLYYNCIGGNEKIITAEYGLVPISSVVNEDLTLLTSDGWSSGEIKSFGKDILYNVHFKRRGTREDRIVRATLNHRWRISDNSFVETKDLKSSFTKGYDYIPASRIEYYSAPRPTIDKNSLDYIYGVRHGIIYGDGTTIKKCERNLGYSIRICSDKEDILPYFEPYAVTYPPSFGGDPVVSLFDDFSKTHALKELPSENETDEYLVGFFRGLLAADGYISETGKTSICCGELDEEWMRKILVRVGIQFNGSKIHKRQIPYFIKGNEVIPRKVSIDLSINPITLISDDFLIGRKRDRFCGIQKPFWSFSHIDYDSGKLEEVYCAVVPKTSDFVLEDGLLTGNCPLISRAMDICAAEVIQADTNMIPIQVEAPEDQKDFILEFYDKISLYKQLTPTIKDIVKFGNSVWVLGMDDNGITEIIPTEIRQLRDRLEFTPYMVEEELNKNKIYTDYVSIERVRNLVDHILNNSDETTKMFKRYLIGFQLHDYILPPWRVIHFRNATTESPFDPFGVPFYIHAIAPYKMWDAGQTFKTMARALNFPIEKWTINLPNVVDPTEKFNRVRQFINKLDNVAFKWQNKEDQTMGQRVFAIKDLLEYEMVKPDIDLKDMEETSLREELVVATRLPRFIIDPRETGFGEGGSTLVEKWKEFARFVFTIQSIFLENLSQLTKMHMILSGKFQEDEIDFILSMPFPERKNSDLVESQNRLLDFSKSLMDTISEKLFNGQPIPKEVAVSILHQMNIFDQTVIDGWVDILDKNKPTTPINNPDDMGLGGSDSFMGEALQLKHKLKKFIEQFDDSNIKEWKKLEESTGKKKLDEQITSLIFKQRQKTFKEGVMKRGHFYSSTNKSTDFDPYLLRKWDVERVKKLQEVSELVKDNEESKQELFENIEE